MWKLVSKNCSTNEYINEFVVILKLINFKKWETEIRNFEKFQNPMVIKNVLTLVVIFFQVHLRNSQKIIETDQLDDCKVEILENQSELDILTKDLVWNIEKKVFKKSKKYKE